MGISPVGFLSGFKNAGVGLAGFSEVLVFDAGSKIVSRASKMIPQEIKEYKPICEMCKEKVGLYNDIPDLFVKSKK